MEEQSFNKTPIDSAVLQVILEEISNGQQVANTQIAQLLKDMVALNTQLNDLKELKVQRAVNSVDYTITIRSAIEKGLRKYLENDIPTTAKTTKEYRLLLFPEQDRKLFYKIVFGRWLLYLVIMLLLNNGYQYARHRSDNQKQIRMQKIKNERLERSWQYLYKHGSKATKKQMEAIYSKPLEAEINE